MDRFKHKLSHAYPIADSVTYGPFQPLFISHALRRYGLRLLEAPPCSSLTDIVHSYLQISASRATPYPVIPDGTQALYISEQGVQVAGALTHLHEVRIPQAGDYFGIRFHPGALRRLFKIDVSEITDGFVDSKFIPCGQLKDLHERIYDQKSFDQRVAVCRQWLLSHSQTTRSGPFEQALNIMQCNHTLARIDGIAKYIGWSARHLNRQFQLHTGLSAKGFSQVMRLQQACRHLFQENAGTTSIDHGFYDQSHEIRAFHKYLLCAPGEFHRRFMSDLYNP